MKINSCIKTDIGIERKRNEDYAAVVHHQNNFIAILCDGMGGYKGGEVASKAALNSLKSAFKKQSFTNFKLEEIVDWFQKEIDNVTFKLEEINQVKKNLDEMGTTLVCALFLQDIIAIFNIGDSRAYIIDNKNKLKQITADQNMATEIQKIWDISYEEAIHFPNASLLTSVIGIDKKTNIDISFLNIKNFKSLLLTSDGIHDYLYSHQIETILNKEIAIDAKLDRLISQALEQGSNDNLTGVLIEIKK